MQSPNSLHAVTANFKYIYNKSNLLYRESYVKYVHANIL